MFTENSYLQYNQFYKLLWNHVVCVWRVLKQMEKGRPKSKEPLLVATLFRRKGEEIVQGLHENGRLDMTSRLQFLSCEDKRSIFRMFAHG